MIRSILSRCKPLLLIAVFATSLQAGRDQEIIERMVEQELIDCLSAADEEEFCRVLNMFFRRITRLLQGEPTYLRGLHLTFALRDTIADPTKLDAERRTYFFNNLIAPKIIGAIANASVALFAGEHATSKDDRRAILELMFYVDGGIRSGPYPGYYKPLSIAYTILTRVASRLQAPFLSQENVDRLILLALLTLRDKKPATLCDAIQCGLALDILGKLMQTHADSLERLYPFLNAATRKALDVYETIGKNQPQGLGTAVIIFLANIPPTAKTQLTLETQDAVRRLTTKGAEPSTVDDIIAATAVSLQRMQGLGAHDDAAYQRLMQAIQEIHGSRAGATIVHLELEALEEAFGE